MSESALRVPPIRLTLIKPLTIVSLHSMISTLHSPIQFFHWALSHTNYTALFFFFSLLKPGHNKVFYLCFCLTKKPNLKGVMSDAGKAMNLYEHYRIDPDVLLCVVPPTYGGY